MDISPLANAGPLIQSHVASALLALALGPVILLRKKGTPLHRRLGKLWVVSMALTIFSAAFIYNLRMFGPFSPIHVLALLATWWLYRAISHARHGRIAAHQASMKRLYFWALGVAGVFTFWPRRVFSRMFFPENPMLGFYIVLTLFLVIFSAYWLGTSKSKATLGAKP